MMPFFIYLLKASACLTLFYLLYLLFFSRLTFFTFNRFYLLAGIALSFAIPLAEIELPAPAALSPVVITTTTQEAAAADIVGTTTLNPIYREKPLDLMPFAAAGYAAGATALLFRLLSSFVRVRRVRRRAMVVSRTPYMVLEAEGLHPFSFFNAIFVPRSGDNRLMVEHEKVHVRQRHWADLLFMEAAILLLWFNPFVFLYRRALRAQHEFLADRGITRTRESIPDYLGCMLRQVQFVSAGSPAIDFFGKTIKKRVIMITKNKTPRRYALLYLLSLPVAAVLVAAFASYTYAQGPAAVPAAPAAVTVPAAAPVLVSQPAKAASTPPKAEVKLVEADIVNITRDPDASTKTSNKPLVTPDPLSYIPSIYPVKAVENVRISGNFGKVNGSADHNGLDIAAPEGTEVVSTAPGVVVKSEYHPGFGNYIEIKHGDVYTTFYAHQKENLVKEGDSVKKGQVIGTVGSTGKSTGPHVHYEVRKNGTPVDPTEYLNRITE